MIAVSFTGTSKDKLSATKKDLIAHTIRDLAGDPAAFYSGAAPGVDVWAAECAIRLWRGAEHHVLIPSWAETGQAPSHTLPHDAKALRRLSTIAAELGVYLRYQWVDPGVGSEAAGYLDRDDALAQACTHMVAFPSTGREQQRSGTWATVRRARKLDRPVLVVPLNKDKPYKLAS